MKNLPDKIGKYEIKEIVSKGSTGIVYKAYDPYIKRYVAIKTLKQDLIDDYEEEFSKRFYKEAQIAGTLNHPNIAIIYDAGEYEDGSFICMEYIEGIPLNKWIEQTQHSFIIQNILNIITQIANALDYAHSQGVIHRDIKPANIIITNELQAKILDFGIALFANIRTTKEGKVIGTPHYMAPEQILGQKIDHRVDIFALGVIAYEAITGAIPFQADTITGIISRIAYDKPDHPKNIENIGFILSSWENVFSKVLAKNPADRYVTAMLFVKDLSEIFPKIQYENMQNLADIPPILDKTAVMDADFIREEIIGTIESDEKSKAISEKEIKDIQEFLPTTIEDEQIVSESSELISEIEEQNQAATIIEKIVAEQPKEQILDLQKPPVQEEEEIIELQETDTILIKDVISTDKPIVKKKGITSKIIISLAVLIVLGITFFSAFHFNKSRRVLEFSKSLQKPITNVITSQIIDNVDQKVSFIINSFPEGAEVYQENILLGLTPFTIVDVSKLSSYSIKLRKKNYEDLNYEITPLPINYSINLALPIKSIEAPKFAILKIISEPNDSNIFIQGKPYGKTPTIVKDLKPGTYKITIQKDGYKSWEKTTTIKANNENIIQANLEKISPKNIPIRNKAETIKKPEIITNPIPIKKSYPSKPSRAPMKGDVKLELIISAKGEVEDVKILEAPDPILAAEAVKSAKKWTFKPATKDGKPTKGTYKLVFRFQ